MKSNKQINNEVEILKKENEELKTRLSINAKIIQEFFKNSNIEEKTSLFIENIKKENNILMKEINDLKEQNQKLILKNENISNPNKINLETYENKLFIYENLLKEKQSIIVNLKEQNKNLQSFIDSNITKKEIKQDIEKENDNNIINNTNNKYIIEEIYVISPQQLLNTLNDKTELYKDINFKLKNLLQEMKTRLLNKEKENLKLEEELTNLKQELQNVSKLKNNEEIINQLIQYQSMKSLPTSQSCSNFNSKNFLKNKNRNTRNKKTRSLSYINNHTHDLKKIMKEIEVYENVNKTVKEISKNDFDLTEEWAETLKQCGMTQEEFLKFCGMKITNKLTNALEYMYKILVDKNIQIKLLTKENETLNEENIRLNKINIQMETMVDYYEKSNKDNKNKNNNDHNNDFINIYENIFNENLNKNKNNKNIKSNTFFEEDKFTNNKIFNNSSSQNKTQKTYVNVDNNITHTNININMMMDYNNRNNASKNLRSNTLNKNAITQNNLLLDESSIKNKKNEKIKNFEYFNKSGNKYKSNEKIFKHIKLRNKKIDNNSYNKLIKEKKNILICKTLNLSNIKKPRKVFCKINNNSLNYNKTIKNIFSNTEKMLLKNKERNTVTIGNDHKNINLNNNSYFTEFKLENKYKRKINKNENL